AVEVALPERGRAGEELLVLRVEVVERAVARQRDDELEDLPLVRDEPAGGDVEHLAILDAPPPGSHAVALHQFLLEEHRVETHRPCEDRLATEEVSVQAVD